MANLNGSWLRSRETALRTHFGLPPDTVLRSSSVEPPEMSPAMAEHFSAFNLEWHLIPSESSVPFDERYCSRMYPKASKLGEPFHKGPCVRSLLAEGHHHHTGRIVAIETTMKPGYLPGHKQCYGTRYGFDEAADPLIGYMEQVGFEQTTRYNHSYLALRTLLQRIADDWRSRGVLPAGYRVTICPPAVFNLIGTVFHSEWSETESLEVGFYVDPSHTAHCYAVGATQPGDFSFVRPIEPASDWKMFGFRLALVPVEDSRPKV